MVTDLDALVRSLAGVRAVVLGEVMRDEYWMGESRRLCPEAPVPVVAVSEIEASAGGAGNAAVNISRLGGTVRLLGVAGDDEDGRSTLQGLAEAGVDVSACVAEPGRRTLTKRRIMAAAQVLVRCDSGDMNDIAPDTEALLLAALDEAWNEVDLVVVSDYGYGVVTPALRAALSRLQAREPRTLVVDSKDLGAYREARPTAVKPNFAEAMALVGEDPASSEQRVLTALRIAGPVLEACGSCMVAMTLDADGALVVERGQPPTLTPAEARPEAHPSGAGDAYLAAFGLALAAGADASSSARLASRAAALAVRKRGTAWVSAQDLAEDDPGTRCVLSGIGELAAACASHRRRGQRIVFTNGCFDILHKGHLAYLERARGLGDLLVVAVNDDESVRRLKGPSRPVNRIDDRLGVISALDCVDHVVSFAEDTPERLIRAARPDVFAKGGDYTRETLPEAPLVEALGGIVEILALEPERSTTRIIDRVRDLAVVAGSA